MTPRDSEPLAETLRSFAKGGLAGNDNHSTQLAINGLVWSFQLMAERADKLDVLAAVESALYAAEGVGDLNLSGLEALKNQLREATRV
jgi:hypothetical protein